MSHVIKWNSYFLVNYIQPHFTYSTAHEQHNEPIDVKIHCNNTRDDSNDPPGIKKLNLVFDPHKADEREKAVEEAKDQYNREFGSMNVTQSYHSLFEILWYSQLPCFDVRNITSEQEDEMSLIKDAIGRDTK